MATLEDSTPTKKRNTLEASTPTKKRKTEDYEDISSVFESSSNASVHGVVARLSPMKRGKNSDYYEGQLSDGKKNIRLYGFNDIQRKKLQTYNISKEAVNIVDCEIKKVRGSTDKLEVFVNQFSEITNSSREFEVGGDVTECTFTLEKLESTGDFETVSLSNVSVIKVEIPVQVSGGLNKQDAYISNGNVTAKLTLWEEDMGKLEEGRSYTLNDVMVRSYNGKKYLSFARGATITSEDQDETEDHCLDKCEVIGVSSLQVYRACLSCKHIIQPTNQKIASCSKCNMKQRLDRCKVNIKARLLLGNSEHQKLLNASGLDVINIAEVAEDQVTEEALLMATPFSVTYKNNKIICVRRE